MKPERLNLSLSELSREELYELVWMKPAIAVAKDFGISAKAVVTHCEKHDVPRPSRGHWTTREEKPAGALMSARQRREENLFKAADLWHRHRLVEEFLAACESRWRGVQAGIFTTGQEQWLQWARGIVSNLSPFEAGYPDPLQDGTFDAGKIPLGGPYPDIRKFE